MKLREMTQAELEKAYETDLKEAFPPAELKPLRAIERMRQAGIYDPLALFDEDGEALGYILLWKHEDGRYILIDYLCVPAGRRCGGTGGKLLELARARYPADTVFIGESEAPTGDPAAWGSTGAAGRRSSATTAPCSASTTRPSAGPIRCRRRRRS